SAARPRPPGGTVGGHGSHPSRSGCRTPWPHNWPPARPPFRRRLDGRAGEDGPAAPPTHRTSRGPRAGLSLQPTRTHVRTFAGRQDGLPFPSSVVASPRRVRGGYPPGGLRRQVDLVGTQTGEHDLEVALPTHSRRAVVLR